MRQVLMSALMIAMTTSASAQDVAIPIEQMNCEQLYAEYARAGSPKLDPALSAKIAGMQQRSTTGAQMGQIIAEQAATMAVCMVPGAGMVCSVVQEVQGARQNAQTKRLENESSALLAEVDQATAGIDMDKMAAITIRSEALKCPPPPSP